MLLVFIGLFAIIILVILVVLNMVLSMMLNIFISMMSELILIIIPTVLSTMAIYWSLITTLNIVMSSNTIDHMTGLIGMLIIIYQIKYRQKSLVGRIMFCVLLMLIILNQFYEMFDWLFVIFFNKTIGEYLMNLIKQQMMRGVNNVIQIMLKI
jgi:hypothetical protein